jgi:hypothetical protein
MSRYKIGEKVDIRVERQEANMDRACDEAYRMALIYLGIDDDGYANNVKDAGRDGSIMLQFVSFIHGASMVGHAFTYHFQTWIEAQEDEDD